MKLPNRVARKQRKRLATAIRAWLGGELTMDELTTIAMEAEGGDVGLNYVAGQFVWLLDDAAPQPGDLEKPEWDSLQRMLLLLDSDRRLVRDWRFIWTRSQWVAVFAVTVFVLAATMIGWKLVVFVSVPFFLVSWRLARFRSRLRAKPYANVLAPFGSFEQLR